LLPGAVADDTLVIAVLRPEHSGYRAAMLTFLLAVVLTGLVVGALARLLVPGPDPMGFGGTILVGIAGGLLAGLLSRALFGDQTGPGLLLSVGVTALLVLLLRPRTGMAR
jgi:uncharacterized membrane protein YeaQ/YmgE (transglycosylase-associated protein family)